MVQIVLCTECKSSQVYVDLQFRIPALRKQCNECGDITDVTWSFWFCSKYEYFCLFYISRMIHDVKSSLIETQLSLQKSIVFFPLQVVLA